MTFEWITPLIFALGACIAFFLSKPERLWLTFVAIFCVVLAGGWEASRNYSDLKTKRELQASIERRLIRQTDSFLRSISDMVVYASDGQLPKTEAEFFSSSTAQRICRELDLSAPAPVYPERPWSSLIYQVFIDFKKNISTILDQNAHALDTELITILDEINQTFLLNPRFISTSIMRVNSKMGAPLLCWGWETLAEESLDSLHRLFQILKNREEDAGFSPNHDWLYFPEEFIQTSLGRGRFSAEDLKDWQKQNPNSSGPAKFGTVDPRKHSIQ